MVKAELPRVWIRRNWFVPLVAVLLAIEFAFARTVDWAHEARPAEFAVLFDLTITIPALFVLCYRRQLALKPLLLRTIGLACLGIYIASKLVPAPAQVLIAELSWARIAGLVVLALIELKLMIEVVKLAYDKGASAEAIAERSGAPLWIARLMALEARFWKAVWRMIRGR